MELKAIDLFSSGCKDKQKIVEVMGSIKNTAKDYDSKAYALLGSDLDKVRRDFTLSGLSAVSPVVNSCKNNDGDIVLFEVDEFAALAPLEKAIKKLPKDRVEQGNFELRKVIEYTLDAVEKALADERYVWSKDVTGFVSDFQTKRNVTAEELKDKLKRL